MRTVKWVAALAALALLIGAGVGCKDNEPQSELDRFSAWATGLEHQAMLDTLRTLAGTDGDKALYADFVLGNWFYQLASDSAAVNGWGEEPAKSLMDSSEVHFMRAVDRDTTFVEALVNLGSIWDDRSQQMAVLDDRKMRMDKAEMYYRKALAVDPADEKARCNLGGLYMRVRKTPEALAEFQTALEYDPESALAHYNLAIMFAEAKIYREAIREWELAVKYDPDGDIGNRSRENIKIVDDLMNAPTPANVQ